MRSARFGAFCLHPQPHDRRVLPSLGALHLALSLEYWRTRHRRLPSLAQTSADSTAWRARLSCSPMRAGAPIVRGMKLRSPHDHGARLRSRTKAAAEFASLPGIDAKSLQEAEPHLAPVLLRSALTDPTRGTNHALCLGISSCSSGCARRPHGKREPRATRVRRLTIDGERAVGLAPLGSSGRGPLCSRGARYRPLAVSAVHMPIAPPVKPLYLPVRYRARLFPLAISRTPDDRAEFALRDAFARRAARAARSRSRIFSLGERSSRALRARAPALRTCCRCRPLAPQ